MTASAITIYLYNVVEDEWNFINAYSDPARKNKDIQEMENTSDCFFMATAAAETNFVYLSPRRVSAKFLTYTQSLFKYKNGVIIVPRHQTHQLSLDLINDHRAFRQLIKRLRPYRQVNLISYSASLQFYELRSALVRAGIPVRTPEAPAPESAWTVNFFGSKSGVRQVAGRLMPPGLICHNLDQACRIAASKYLTNHGVVIKTNKGSGGNGVFIFRNQDLSQDYDTCVRQLETLLSRERYWEKFPLVVEDLIKTGRSTETSFPNIEFKINAQGRVKRLFYGMMAVNRKGEYCGMEVNAATFPDWLKKKALKTGSFIAKKYAAAGYRGHFDIDMMVDKNCRLFVSETNTRNTGWTDIYRIVRKLIGPDFLNQVYVLNRENFPLTENRWTDLDKLLHDLTPWLYSPQTKTGIIINSDNFLKKKCLLYTIIASNKTTAHGYQKKMTALLRPLPHRVKQQPFQ